MTKRTYSIKFDQSAGMTKQSFKNECDINRIMEKFQKTGTINHFAKHAPNYGETTQMQLQDALNIVADANTMFEELPSSIRKRFNNDPGQFLDFVQNPKNAEEAFELGLSNKKPETDPEPTVKPKTTETPPAPATTTPPEADTK